LHQGGASISIFPCEHPERWPKHLLKKESAEADVLEEAAIA
jgi:hypothetical protein